MELLGFVDDLSELYRKIRATAVHIFVAGGTRTKIIEAAAYGKPTVSNAVGAEGIEINDGNEIVIRDTPEEFAEACIKIHTDTELCTSMGLRAREKAIELYDRRNVIKTISKHIQNMLELDKH